MRALGTILGATWIALAAPRAARAKVDTDVLFLNRCTGGGCRVTCTKGMTGAISSVTDETDVCEGGPRTLHPFQFSTAKWNQVVACVADVFAPFGVRVTDVDPGSAKHFEIMIAGSPGDLGLAALAGVASFDCARPYIPNALAFMFSSAAGATDLTADVEKMCSVAAQEIAHSFRLDHVADARDPMSYYDQLARRYFQTAALPCGSDCVNGASPFGQTCTGPGVGTTGPQLHVCQCTGAATQRSAQTLLDIFGDGSVTPPTVAITAPRDGTTVEAGFAIAGVADDDIGVARVDLAIDGSVHASRDAPPFAFAAPADLAVGAHVVTLAAYDVAGTRATAEITAYVSAGCARDTDCPQATDACIGAHCVAGPDATGGLGAACTDGADCASDLCATGAYGLACVVPCDPAAIAPCPDGFACDGACYPTRPPEARRSAAGCDGGGGGDAGWLLAVGASGLLWRIRRRSPA